MNFIIFTFLFTFVITFFVSKLFIPLFKNLKLGQNISDDAPKSHRKKAGVPTFGGVVFIISITIVIFTLHGIIQGEGLVAFYALIVFGIIGLIDDVLSKVCFKNEGLKRKQKMALLAIAASFFAIYAYITPSIGTYIYIPYVNKAINLKLLYIPFLIFYYTGTTNAVNLTDGIDGLCTTITILVFLFFGSYSYITGHHSLALFCAAMIGCLLAFLIFNFYPAKIIMGDTGSLALGGAIATVVMLLKVELLLILVGIIYVIETLSVIIQENSCKHFKRKVFKMAPIHHSFELSGWHEAKIVVVFAIITIIAEITAILLLINIK
ncbi:phospho-N-acetylmuramoyl-pentapeptide-transferase [Oceanirhabdus sp. W0125-5]|uniref:phospho-N-acetylmuramoyl-pentapeptide- transferase n=1 Tax=Oceanirhabdus sp. W0125-5 TaxID=2999116 RepID=UPI0022F32E88|nr:phospho-N-acetylmuramoyl-pentapeptide-transferase [Oceanirhabdus sp. W0125-5]WBW96059.1 phospho-N-acetylmuramoyl-pentapeptide-transferase [Oceanirhabdus sp. W0125-5]